MAQERIDCAIRPRRLLPKWIERPKRCRKAELPITNGGGNQQRRHSLRTGPNVYRIRHL